MIGHGHTCAARCRSCGYLVYPATFVCVRCRGRTFAHEPLSGTGELVSWTSVSAVPRGFEGREPLLLGIVDLQMGLRVMGQLAVEDPHMGMCVKLSLCVVRTLFEKPVQGLILYRCDE
jgi:uncharacterized OB-fold protein